MSRRAWSAAWQSLVRLSPDAACQVRAVLIARAAEDRQLQQHEPGPALQADARAGGGSGSRASGAARASTALNCGIAGVCLSFFVIGIIPTIAAIIVGHRAYHDVRQAGDTGGRRKVLAGLILGYLGTALSIFMFHEWSAYVTFCTSHSGC